MCTKICYEVDNWWQKPQLWKCTKNALDERREKLCLNFAIKCTKNQRTKDMFPLKTKVHNMKSRNTEKYQVQYAHTERFQKSPIIHMQHLLNQNNHWHSNVEITDR